MPASYVVMELVVYALAIGCAVHARRQGGPRWGMTLLVGVLFGVLIETVMVQGEGYAYGRFLVMLGPVPLWVGVGWGVIVYVSTFTAQRMLAPVLLRPAIAAALAVNVDLSLDPIAELYGFWSWNHPPERPHLYDVPLDNFLGWYLIVFLYAAFVRGLFHWVTPPDREGTGRRPHERRATWLDYALPFVGAGLGAGILFLIQGIAYDLYDAVGGETLPFLFFFVLTLWAAVWAALRGPKDLPVAWPVLAVPVVVHGLCFVLFLAAGGLDLGPTLASLAIFLPTNLLLGFFAFGLPSIRTFGEVGGPRPVPG